MAAYCRVSTDSEDQANSLESQKRYFARCIEQNPRWELAEVYADEGITGTSTKKRVAFNRMMADAYAREFDLIITKEISRFARNTLDSIFYTRQLRDMGIGVIFMNDSINTLDPDAELRLTILSSIAQEESRKTSERVKWGQKRRMEQGVVFGRDMLGYDVRGGRMYVNETGAQIVRTIFHKFVREQKGAHVIARELREDGVPTAAYMKQWSNTVILRILRNEKYCGDLVQKKTITPNYLNHEKKPNRGEEALVVLRDHHEPIVSRELFDEAQRELARRAPSAEQRAKHSSRYSFSGRVRCGICGASYVPRVRERRDGSCARWWRCRQAASHGRSKTDRAGNEIGCNGRTVREEVLRVAAQQAVKALGLDAEGIARTLTDVLRAAMWEKGRRDPADTEGRLRLAREKRLALLDLYLGGGLEKHDFLRLSDRYQREIARLEREKERPPAHGGQGEEKLAQAESVVRCLASGEEWDDAFYRRLLEKITVYPGHILDVKLCLTPRSRHCIAIAGKELEQEWASAAPGERAAARAAAQAALGGHIASSEGTEELAHMEMICAIVHQLTRNLTIEQIKEAGFDTYFVDHTSGLWPQAASGTPFSATVFQSKGDAITDLTEDMAAEQKARTTYDNILRLVDDPDVRDPIKFLREREIVHFQRFGEAMRIVTDKLDSKNVYAFNLEFDRK